VKIPELFAGTELKSERLRFLSTVGYSRHSSLLIRLDMSD
jgi:hypothetical protein